jgi:hypothetical protein
MTEGVYIQSAFLFSKYPYFRSSLNLLIYDMWARSKPSYLDRTGPAVGPVKDRTRDYNGSVHLKDRSCNRTAKNRLNRPIFLGTGEPAGSVWTVPVWGCGLVAHALLSPAARVRSCCWAQPVATAACACECLDAVNVWRVTCACVHCLPRFMHFLTLDAAFLIFKKLSSLK